MNSKKSIPFFFQRASADAGNAINWTQPRLSSGHRDAVVKGRILAIDEDFSVIPNLLCLLHEDGFLIDIKSPMNFTVVAEDMFDDYQAVIVDVMIPHSNGFDLLRDICNTTQLPVLVLTARNDEEDRIAGLKLGADDYVAKPCRPREVVARIRALLRRRARCDRLLCR